MKLEKMCVVKLNDQKEYAIASTANYENESYYYLVGLNDPSSVKFCREKKEGEQIKLAEVEDPDLLEKLLPLFLSNAQDIIYQAIQES